MSLCNRSSRLLNVLSICGRNLTILTTILHATSTLIKRKDLVSAQQKPNPARSSTTYLSETHALCAHFYKLRCCQPTWTLDPYSNPQKCSPDSMMFNWYLLNPTMHVSTQEPDSPLHPSPSSAHARPHVHAPRTLRHLHPRGERGGGCTLFSPGRSRWYSRFVPSTRAAHSINRERDRNMKQVPSWAL